MKRMLALLLVLLPASLFAADLTGTFAPGERYEAPAGHAPVSVSRMFVRTIARDNASIELPAAGESGLLVWTIPVSTSSARAPRARLTTPTGDVLTPRENGSVDRGLRRFRFDAAEVGMELPQGTHEVLHVMRTAAASYRLDVDMPEDVAGIMVVAAEPESRITLETWVTPLSRQPGQPVTLHARLREDDAPIAGAAVTARLAPPRSAAGTPVELFDDGQHADELANDGVYAAVVAELPARVPGSWQARFEANGVTATGVRFARSGGGELIAERGAARLHDVRAVVVDGTLRVTASAEVAIAGSYRFDVIVAGPADASGSRPALAWAEGVRELATGAQSLALELPVSGTGLHLDVRLLGLDPIGVAGRVEVDLGR